MHYSELRVSMMKKLTITTILLLITLVIRAQAQDGPARVRKADGTSPLVLWLNSSTGTSTTSDAAALTGWNDQSGYGNNGAQGTGVRQPLFYSTTYHINNYPVIRFDGDLSGGGANGDRIEIPDAANLDNTSGLSVFSVVRPTTLDGNPRGYISKRTTSGSQEAYSAFFYTSDYLNVDIASNARKNSSSAFTAGTSYITSFVYSNPNLNLFTDGTNVSSSSSSSTSIPNSTAALFLGQLQGNNSGYYAGDIAEVLVYTTALNTVEKTLIENYLSSKYNISISNDRFAYEATYGTEIYGIGQESDGDKPTNISSLMRLTIDSFSNGTYLLWGHNNSAATLTEVTDLPTGNNARLERVWRVDYTGSPASTSVKINTNGLTLGGGETFRLLVDSDGTFATGALQYAGTLVGDTLVVSNVVFDSDVYITLGKVTASASSTYYSYQDGDWETANSWTTDPSGFTQIPVGGQVPAASGSVSILNGRTITIPTSDAVAKTLTNLTIAEGGVLDITNTTGHDFGVISGNGKLKLNTLTLPSGSLASFVTSNGGTMEFYDLSGTLPASQTSYNNLILSNSTGSSNTLTQANNLTINGTFDVVNTGAGSLLYQIGNNTTSRTLTVNGDATVTSASLGVGSSAATHTVNFLGNLTNTSGVLDFANGSGNGNVYFKGSTDNTVTLNGTLNEFYFIELNKGTDQTFILTVDAGVGSNFSITKSSGNKINLKNGTIKLASANISLSGLGNGSNYNIGSDANTNGALWIDGATVTSTSAYVIYGKLIISSGSLSIAAEGLVIREDGEILLEGGTLTVEKYRISTAGGTHRGTLTITGGTFNIDNTLAGSSNNGYAAFSIPFSTQFFSMSGGTVNVKYAESGGLAANGGIQINADPSNINVTGGTWNVYIPNGTTNFNIASNAPFYDLNIIKNGVGAGKARIADINSAEGNVAASTLVVLNDFTLSSTGSPVFDANGFDVKVARNFTINTGASYTNTGADNTVHLTHEILNTVGSLQTITLNTSTTFDNFLVNTDNSATFAGSTNPTITGNLSIESGDFIDGGKTITVQGDVYNTSTHSGTGVILLQGSSLQTISGSGTFQNLTIDNASNVQLTGDATINGNLRLANGLVQLTSKTLTLSETSAIYDAATGTGTTFSSTKMITTSGLASNGGLKKLYSSAGGSFRFPLGTASDFTPATINVTNTGGSAGTLTVKPVLGEHPNVSVSGSSLAYYWKVSKTGFGAAPVATLGFTYIDSDIVGTEANYVYGLFNNTSATWTAGVVADVDETTNLIGGTGTALEGTTSIVGDFTAGEVASFGAVNVYYSKASGDWNSTTTWSNVSHVGADAATPPGATDFVIIGDGATNNHSIYVLDAGSASAATLKISSGSSLDIRASVGNTFTNVIKGGGTGFGTLRLNSSTFPSGDWTLFVAASGGTVEYYTDASGDLSLSTSQTTYNVLSLVNDDVVARVITLPAADLSIISNLKIGSATNGASLDVQTENTGTRSISVGGNLTVTGVNGGNTTDYIFRTGAITNLTVTGGITISADATFQAEASGATTHTLSLYGSIVNNGLLDFNTGATNIASSFLGTTNQTITGTGSTYEFNAITVDKGLDETYSLEVNAANATLSGAITLTNGTLKLTNSTTVTLINSAVFSIPATAQLFINGSTAQITGTGTLSLVGKLKVDSGTLNIGTTNQNNVIEYSASGTPTIEINGGTTTVNSQIRRPTVASSGNLNFTMTNGTLIVGNEQAPTVSRAVFEVLNSGTFTMSNGTIQIIRAQTGSSASTIAALYLRPAGSSVTGGTIQIGGTSTPASQTIFINSTVTFYDLTVKTTNSPTAKLKTTGITVSNDLLIESGATFNANGLTLTIGNGFTNSGTFTPASNTTTFTGTSASITGATTFYALTYSSTGTLTVNNDITVSSTLTNSTSGTISTSTLSLTAKGDVSNNGTISSTTGKLILQNTSSQVISGNGSGIFARLEIDNISGVSTSATIQISDVLFLKSGVFSIASNLLDITNSSASAVLDGSSGTTFTTTNMIKVNGSAVDLGIRKAIPTGASDFTFPVGVTTGYTPVRFNFSSNTAIGTITVKAISTTISSKTDDNGDGLDLLDYYWIVSHTGLGTYNVTHQYTYLESDVQTQGATSSDADYFPGRFESSTWSSGAGIGSINTATNVITVDGGAGGVNYVDGSYTAGAIEEFGLLQTYYSIVATGNWEDSNSWSTISHVGAAAAGTPNGNPVRIDAAHHITVTANSKSSTSLFVDGILTIGTTTGHSFGTVTGTGTISLATNIFPGGDFTTFTDVGGGTIEFGAGTFTLSTRTTYNNLSISSAGTKTLPNVDIHVNGNVSLTAGVLNSSSFNKAINVKGDWTNNASTVAFTPGTNTVTFSGTGAQAISGTFATSFYNLTVNKSGTLTINTNTTITNDLTLTAGTLDLNSQTITLAKNLTNNAGAASISNTSGTMLLNGSSTQTIQGSFDSQFYNLTLNNTSAIGVSLSKSVNLYGTLTFTDGHLQTNANSLNIQSAGALSGEHSNNYVVGTLQISRVVGVGSSTFGNIGFTINAGTSNLGTVTVKRVTGTNGKVTVGAKEGIKRRWVITNTGANPYIERTLSYSWVANDDNGKDMSLFRMYKRPVEGSGAFVGIDEYQTVSTASDTRTISVLQNSFSEVSGSDFSSPLPIELASVQLNPTESSVILNWETFSEHENLGFEIIRKFKSTPNVSQQDTSWINLSFIKGNGSKVDKSEYHFEDKTIQAAGTYQYKIKQIDFDGASIEYGPYETVYKIPEKIELQNAYPNPFNPSTLIPFTISKKTNVRIEIFNVLGQRVRVLLNKEFSPGTYSTTFDGQNEASGVYIIRLVADGHTFTKKILLIK